MNDRSRFRPAILAEAGVHAEWITKPLLARGFEVSRCGLEDVPDRLASNKFNVLLLGRFYTLRKTKQQEEDILERLGSAMRNFLEAGGGVFFVLPVGGVLPFDGLLGPYGVRILELGMTQTEDAVHRGEAMDPVCYGYSTDVKGVYARDVDGIWYPAALGHAMASRPVHTSGPEWDVILSGGPSSRTIADRVGGGNSVEEADDSLPQYASHVPLVCGREVGPGRLAVCGIPSGYNVDSPHTCSLARSFLLDGFEGKPSGMRQFLLNVVDWLAEPSRCSGQLGGATSDPDVLLPQVPRFPDDPPVLWTKREFPPDDPRPLRGLIGARTTYSIGSSTPDAYVERARAAGLDFIVFLEDFACLTPDKLESLKADCERLSTDAFLAVPGYTIADVADAHYFQYGYRIVCPKDDILSADRTMLSVRDPDAPQANTRNVRMDALQLSFLFSDLGAKVRRGRYLHGETPVLFLDHRACDSTALVTWQDGKIVDDARDRYRALEDRSMRVNPVVLTLMDRAEDVDRALADGWKNLIIEPYQTVPDKVLRKWMAPELEWWGMIDEERVRHPRFRFDNWQCGAPFQYVSNGPEVQAWTASVTSRDPGWRGPDTEIPPVGDLFRVDPLGFRLRIKAGSEAGLSEVLLFDGETVIRRWQPGGERAFELELDLMHHQQMHLGLEVRDVDGKRAICLDYPTLRLDWCEFYCADRNNPLAIGFEKDERGLAFGWAGTIYLTYNGMQWGGTSRYVSRWWYGGDALHPVPNDPVHDERLPTDGGVRASGAGLHVMIQMPQLDPPEIGLGLAPHQRLISPDVAIDDLVIDHGYDPAWPFFFGHERTGFGSFPSAPTRYVDCRRRAYVYRPKPYALSTLIYEYDLRWKRNPHLREPLRIGWLEPATEHVLHRADGSRLCLAGRDETACRTTWKHGESIVSWTNGRQPAVFFNDGPDLLLERDTEWPEGKLGPTEDQHGLLTFWLPVESLPGDGDTTRLRFAAMGGSYTLEDAEVGETAYRAMGLCGEPAYRVDVQAGKVLSTRLVLELDGAGEGAAFKLPRADLPAALPVQVHGLNENWTVALCDRAGRRWRPVGILEGTAHAVVDAAARDWDLFIGHPVTASDPDLVLNLVQTGDRQWLLEVHNPTGQEVTARVAASPFFPLLGWAGEACTLPAGGSKVLRPLFAAD